MIPNARPIATFVAVLALTAAAAASAPDSGVRGTVTIGPTCPVERYPPDPACADRPYDARLHVVTRPGGRLVKSFRSGSDGRFRVALAVGRYRLEPKATGTPPTGRPVDFTVHAHRFTTVNLAYDSGIR